MYIYDLGDKGQCQNISCHAANNVNASICDGLAHRLNKQSSF